MAVGMVLVMLVEEVESGHTSNIFQTPQIGAII